MSLDITCYNSCDIILPLALATSGTPYVLTGAVVAMNVIPPPGGTAITPGPDGFTASTAVGNGRITVNGTAGTIAISLPATAMVAATPGVHTFDILVKLNSIRGIGNSPIPGRLNVKQGLTFLP